MDLFPDLNNPRLFIELQSGERSPEEIEQEFVESIEAQAIRQKNAVQVSSVSRVGSALITVEYAWNTNMDEAFLDLQKSMNSFSRNGDIDELTFTQYDPNAEPVILLAFSHPEIEDMDELRQLAESYIRNEFIRLEGIADVHLLGQEQKEVVVSTDPYLLEAYNISPSNISSKIQEFNQTISGGSIVEMGTNYVIKGFSEFESIQDIGQVIVAYTQTSSSTTGTGTTQRTPVLLEDVAEITFRNKDPENIVRLDGRRCMGLAVYKETKYNTITAVNDFMASLDTVRKALPGYELTIIKNQGKFIATAVDEVEQTALIGILLAVIVLFVFLRRIGTTLVVSLAIPVSVMATFNLMYFNGLTLNIMTLESLALGAGMLVDNAIVVMENIFRNMETGMSGPEAAVQGASEVGGAIVASTITTVVVFLPIVFLHGASSELFKDQALTVAFSLLSSLAVALFVIPMISSRLLKHYRFKTKQGSVKFGWYGRLLGGLLKLRWPIAFIAALMIAGAVYLIPIVGSEFVPKTDLNEFSIELTLPAGTELNRTESTVDNLEKQIASILGDDLDTVFSIVGPSREMGGSQSSLYQDENTAVIRVVLKPDRRYPAEVVLARLDAAIGSVPGIQANLVQEQTALQFTMGSDTAPVTIEIEGQDLDVLQRLTTQTRDQMAEIPELFNIETNFDEGRPEINIVLDRVRAGIYDVGINTVTSELGNYLVGTSAGEWDTGSDLTDINIELPKPGLNDLAGMMVSGSGRKVRLDEIADFEITEAPAEITHRNQTRVGIVSASIESGIPLDQVVMKIEEAMGNVSLPPNYRYSIGGEEQQRRESFANLGLALLLSLVLVYMVLASQFVNRSCTRSPSFSRSRWRLRARYTCSRSPVTR